MLEPELRALLTRHNVDMEDVRTLIGIFDHPDSTAGQQAHALAGLSETNLARALLDVEAAYLAQRAELERLRTALKTCATALQDNLSAAAYKNEPVMLTAYQAARAAVEPQHER